MSVEVAGSFTVSVAYIPAGGLSIRVSLQGGGPSAVAESGGSLGARNRHAVLTQACPTPLVASHASHTGLQSH